MKAIIFEMKRFLVVDKKPKSVQNNEKMKLSPLREIRIKP